MLDFLQYLLRIHARISEWSTVNPLCERNYQADLKAGKSLSDILKILKLHNFKIIEGVDVEEVSTFVKWIEMSETLIE
jgi:hypothetical protein